MVNTRFYTLDLGDRKFFGEVSASGPVIVDERALWVSLGVCSIVKLVHPAWQRVRLAGGGHHDSLIDPVPRWSVVRYVAETRINIDNLSDGARKQLSEASGIPIREAGFDAGDVGQRFLDSAAAAGLREWAAAHPRLLNQYRPFDQDTVAWGNKAK